MDRVNMCPGFVPALGCRLQMYITWRYEKLLYLIESLSSGKRIVLNHKSSSKCAINAGLPQNFLSDIISFE